LCLCPYHSLHCIVSFIGVSAGRGTAPPPKKNVYGRAIEQKSMCHSGKHITHIKVDKKNRGLQWIIKYNNANINCFFKIYFAIYEEHLYMNDDGLWERLWRLQKHWALFLVFVKFQTFSVEVCPHTHGLRPLLSLISNGKLWLIFFYFLCVFSFFYFKYKYS
jgi:hypothetical protein